MIEDLNTIGKVVKIIDKFIFEYPKIDIVEGENFKEFIAFNKAWYSTKKNVISTLRIEYGKHLIPENWQKVYDTNLITVQLNHDKLIAINNGLAQNYSKLVQENAQQNFKNDYSGQDYIKILGNLIDSTNAAQTTLSSIIIYS